MASAKMHQQIKANLRSEVGGKWPNQFKRKELSEFICEIECLMLIVLYKDKWHYKYNI